MFRLDVGASLALRLLLQGLRTICLTGTVLKLFGINTAVEVSTLKEIEFIYKIKL